MIDWKKEYERLCVFLVAKTILLMITLIMFSITFGMTANKLEEQQDKIWKLEVEKEELKEQIYVQEVEE